MSLRLRVFAALAGLLALTVLGAWLVAGAAVVQPLLQGLSDERLDTAVMVARRLREEPLESRRALARELSREQGLRLRLFEELPEPPPGSHLRTRVVQREGYTLYTLRGPSSPVLVAMGEQGGPPYLGVHFKVDLERPPRAIGAGLVLLLLVAGAGALLASRWMLAPLELARQAMQRVEAGDLSHRVAEGADATGQIGLRFNRMARRVEALLTGQRELMAAVSHELRTPLSRMRLNLELLRDEGAAPARVEAIEADIEEVDALVGELLESARLHQGQLALRREEVALGPLVEEALGAVDLGARERRVEVQPLTLLADRGRLLRVLRNLLSNVQRYTPPDARVQVRGWREGGEIAISVADSGPGLSEEERARIFEPFYRAEGSRSRVTGGLGLGLMLVRQIVEAHGGRVAAQANEGGGLRVELRLPRGEVPDAEALSAAGTPRRPDRRPA